MQSNHYIIRGGIEGRERLRLLSSFLRPTTLALLDRAGLKPGMTCLEVGAGGGDLAFDMSLIVGPTGKIVGTDIDATKLEIARAEAAALGLANTEFRLADITKDQPPSEFDLAHVRFVLTHLPDPAVALQNILSSLKPGGVIVIEDIDFSGHFCHPPNPAFARYIDLYTRTVQSRGCDANIGPRVPQLVKQAGFQNVQLNVVQLAGFSYESKAIVPVTMENIADAVVASGFASRDEVNQMITELHDFANDPEILASSPRLIETWAIRP